MTVNTTKYYRITALLIAAVMMLGMLPMASFARAENDNGLTNDELFAGYV